MQDSSSSLDTSWSQKSITIISETFLTNVKELKKHAFVSDTLLWKIFISVFIEFYTYQDCLKIYIVVIQSSKTFVQVWINIVLHGSGIEDRHLVAGLENAWAGGSRFERVGSQNFNGKWSNWLPVEFFFFHHLFDTPMHLWNKKTQKYQHRNPLKNGSLSENVMKEGERVLFQHFHWKRYRRVLRCGHFATLADLIAIIVFKKLPF